MDRALRRYFDEQLEIVLEELPERARELLEQVPLHVEDYPSKKVRREKNLGPDELLFGLFVGVSHNEQGMLEPGRPTSVIYLYREALLDASCDDEGYIDEDELRAQMRVTVLHELGHFRGLDEDDLEELGYG